MHMCLFLNPAFSDSSINVKEMNTEHRSIAHFYRECEVWPRLNPSTVLAPLERPVILSASKNMFMGGEGKVSLIALVHRYHWIAGQQCFVKVRISNDTKKTIKSLSLSLMRSTTVFHPKHKYSSNPLEDTTSSFTKQIVESNLEMGQVGSRGHASAKGWWTGVRPGQQLELGHFLLLPVSICKYFEVF